MSNMFRKRLRFGCVNYINALPLLIRTHYSRITLHTAPPADLLDQLMAHQLDAALTSSFGSLRYSVKVQKGFGIAAYKKILSVNFYGSKDFFSSSSPRVAVIRESRSSIMLLKILCHYLWEISSVSFTEFPAEKVMLSGYEGLLLIGDSALHNLEIPGYITYDLAEAWYTLTGLPFVFAVVLTHQDTFSELQEALEASLIEFECDPTSVLLRAQETTLLPESLLNTYYTLCRYRLQEEDYAGLDKFREYYAVISSKYPRDVQYSSAYL